MRYSFLIVLAPLLFGTSLALHINYTGGVLSRDGDATAKILPFQGNPLRNTKADGISKREPTVIKGLLQVRQSCPSGFGECNNSRCCPLGGDCCTRGCCDPGEWCYATGCCDRSETGCEQVTCCPSGTLCCKGGVCCKTSEYCVPGGCCPLGEICSGGGGGGAPPPPPPSHTSTPGTRTTTSTTSPSNSALTPNPTQPPSSRPSANPGEVSVAYEVDDTRIFWTSGWTNATSNCTSKSRRTTVDLELFTVVVASASRIYLNIDVVSVMYDIYVNGIITPANSSNFLDTQSCAYTPLTLSGNTTNIEVTVVIAGQSTNGRKRQISNDWYFQLNEVLTFGSGGNSDTNSTDGTNSTNGAATFEATWFQIIVIVLLVTLDMLDTW